MATTQRRRDAARRRVERLLIDVGDEIRRARIVAGLSQSRAGEFAQMSGSQVARIESGGHESVRLAHLVTLAAVVGLDLSLRAYPGPLPLRDSGHVALLEAFRRRLGPPLRLQTEVPVVGRGDQRAWDAMIFGGMERIGVEAEMRVLDSQALERRIALKQRDASLERVVLLIPDSRANRAAVAAAAPSLIARFPLSSNAILECLRAGRMPPLSGIVVLRPYRRPPGGTPDTER